MGLGLSLQLLSQQAAAEKRRRVIIHHPCYDQFDQQSPPELYRILNRRLPNRATLSTCAKVRTLIRQQSELRRDVRRGNAITARIHFSCGIGARTDGNTSAKSSRQRRNAHRAGDAGLERADNLTEAIAMARTYMGASAEITMLHQPMIGIADMNDGFPSPKGRGLTK